MLDPSLTEALRRLDTLLVQVCHLEETRAERLRGDTESGWSAVRHMAQVPTAELAFSSQLPEASLLGSTPPAAFARLRTAFNSQQVEEEILLLLLAAHLEPRYPRLYSVLQDDTAQGWVLERLLMTVLGRTPARARSVLATLAESGMLVGAGLVRLHTSPYPAMARPIDLAPDVHDALLELPAPGSLGGLSLEWHAAGPHEADAAGASDGEAARGRLTVIHGAGDRAALALRLSEKEGRALVLARWNSREELATARTLWRLAALRGAIPALDLSSCEGPAALAVGEELFRLCRTYGGSAFLLCETAQPLPVAHHEAPALTFTQRRALWQSEAERRGLVLDDTSASRLASNHRIGQLSIQDVFTSASGPDVEALSEAAARLAHVPIRHGHRVPTTRTFQDLVVRDTTRAALERLVFYVQHRDAVAETRGLMERFRLRTGPVVLFSGRSGTGKTLAAEVVAREVGRPLFVIDLSRLVSKYVGETEKNIDEVLTNGERAGAVLLFDEADALFSSRTEVNTSNDRYANLEVGFLLQRIEQHDGLVILATNLQSSIDEAFLRRFHARIEFPFPEPDDRRRIWELMLPPGVQRGGELDLASLAQRHRLAGGDIRNAALKAIFLAEAEGAPLSQLHLERAVALELYELGRLSRRAGPVMPSDAGGRLRRLTEALQESLDAQLRQRFLKEVHVLHGSPTREVLAGKRPAVSVALYRMAAGQGAGLRLGFIVSAWSNRAEEENELLGVLLSLLSGNALTELDGRKVSARVQESYDFDLLQRFWSSHGHPVRASLVLDVEMA